MGRGPGIRSLRPSRTGARLAGVTTPEGDQAEVRSTPKAGRSVVLGVMPPYGELGEIFFFVVCCTAVSSQKLAVFLTIATNNRSGKPQT